MVNRRWTAALVILIVLGRLNMMESQLFRMSGAVRTLLLGGFVVMGSILSLVLWYVLSTSEAATFAARFEADYHARDRVIREAFRDAESALTYLATTFEVSEEITPEQFELLSAPILERNPAIDALGWNPLVYEADRARHEARSREAGIADYQITERRGDGKMIRASSRPWYVAVQLVAPVFGNEAATGFDIASEETRREAIIRARNSGQLALTGRIQLVQDVEDRGSVLALTPVYRRDNSDRTRRGDLRGFAVGVFRVKDMVGAALAPFEPGIRVTVLDETAESSERVVATLGSSSDQPVSESAHSRATLLEWGGRRWRLLYTSEPDYLSAQATWVALAGLLSGFLITLLIAAYVSAQSGHTARVETLVRQRTSELRRTNRSLEDEIEQRKEIERTLAEYRDRLEQRVQERTEELSALVTELRRRDAERAQAQASLKQSERRLRLIIESLSDGGWDWQVTSGEVFFSGRWLQSLGVSRNEIEPTADYWQSLIHPEDRERVLSSLNRHLAGNSVLHECDYRLRTGDGSYRWNLCRGKVVSRDSNGNPLRMVALETDITPRKQGEERERKLKETIRQKQKLESLGLLAGGIAHDFNNLLVGILGNADLALSSTEVDSEIRSDLEQIRAAGTRAADLTRQMLAYSGKASFVFERFSLTEVVGEMSELLRSSTSKHVNLRCETQAEVFAEGDVTQIRQVIMNLITNASDALAGKSSGTILIRTLSREIPSPDLEVGFQELAPGRYAAIEVIDDGCGMDDHTRGLIFDPFFTTKMKGRGLGLAAALGILRSHKGTIVVESQVGHGSRFIVLLPAANPIVRLADVEPLPGDQKLATGRVLVVDDEESVRSLVCRLLDRRGFQVVTAVDGKDGVEKFQEEGGKFDAVVLDVTMPRLSGEEALNCMRGLRPDIGVVFSSGYSEWDVHRSFDGHGPVDFLQKPFRVGELIEKLDRIIRQAGAGNPGPIAERES